MKEKILKTLLPWTALALLANTCIHDKSEKNDKEVIEEGMATNKKVVEKKTMTNVEKAIKKNNTPTGNSSNPTNNTPQCSPLTRNPCGPYSTPLSTNFLNGTHWDGVFLETGSTKSRGITSSDEFTCFFSIDKTSGDTDEGDFSIVQTKGIKPGASAYIASGTYSLRLSKVTSNNIVTFSIKSGAYAGSQKHYNIDDFGGGIHFDYPIAGITYRFFKK